MWSGAHPGGGGGQKKAKATNGDEVRIVNQ